MAKGDKKNEEGAVAVPVVDDKKKPDGKPAPEELSEEDKALKEGLELAVTRLKEDDTSLHKQALDHLVSEIKSATSSMTSVPKPLKFLRNHYGELKAVYESWPLMHSMKRLMADVLSVLGMTMAEPGTRECLRFKLQGTQVNIASWGHEYVRSLAGEISEEFNQRMLDTAADDEPNVDELMVLVDDIVPFQMRHNAEAEAVDLLLEVRQLSKLLEMPVVDERNYERVCLYLLRTAAFIADPDDLETLYDTAYGLYRGQKKYTDALRVAIKVDRQDRIAELFSPACEATEVQRLQMAHILARAHSSFTLEEDETLNEVVSNSNLSEQFLEVVRELDLGAPKAPEEIYKSSGPRGNNSSAAAATAGVDSARANLASTFVNAFVNAGHNSDKLLLGDSADGAAGWLYKNKGHGMMSAAASLGMLMMWNVEEGLNHIDKFFHDSDDFVKSGACLGECVVSLSSLSPSRTLLTYCVFRCNRCWHHLHRSAQRERPGAGAADGLPGIPHRLRQRAHCLRSGSRYAVQSV